MKTEAQSQFDTLNIAIATVLFDSSWNIMSHLPKDESGAMNIGVVFVLGGRVYMNMRDSVVDDAGNATDPIDVDRLANIDEVRAFYFEQPPDSLFAILGIHMRSLGRHQLNKE